ncbi:MAG: GFA family protein [Caulobacteraceae bacterium]
MTETNPALIGGCLCGAIRYAISGKPLFVSQCCCKDCQKATGTGHTTILGIHGSQMRMTGTPATYTNAGESGGKVTRHFCGVCAGRLYTSGDMPGEIIIFQAGSLDDPNQVRPENVIYAKDAPVWDFFDPAIPKYDAMVPR